MKLTTWRASQPSLQRSSYLHSVIRVGISCMPSLRRGRTQEEEEYAKAKQRTVKRHVPFVDDVLLNQLLVFLRKCQ